MRPGASCAALRPSRRSRSRAGSALFVHRLQVDGRDVPVDAPQWWLDDSELRLVLTDRQANERLAVVKAVRKGDAYDGSVLYQGRHHWIRCRES